MATKCKAKPDTAKRPVNAMLANYVRASYPILYLLTPEESRAELEILNVAKDVKRNVVTWSHTEGFHDLSDSNNHDDTTDPIEALSGLKEKDERPTIYIMKDLHPFFNVPKVRRLLRDTARDFKQMRKCLIIISPVNEVPADLERDIVLVEFKLPDKSMLEQTFQTIWDGNKKNLKGLELSDEDKDKIIQSAMGLSINEAENAFAKAIVELVRMDEDIIDKPTIAQLVLKEKANAVRKTGILEYFEASETTCDIGGLENLKLWLDIRKNAFTRAAREFGLPMPRGILLAGLPGCGKSLSAKAASNVLEIPLIRFDIGRVFAGLVGQSEQNMRSAINTIEAIGSCVVWIDEMEKAFAGVGGGGTTDSGVTQRVFGNFITWMQEKKGAAFIMATINRIEGLPPELYRKGRFDEIFFVNLPSDKEREEIFKIHIERRGRDASKFNLKNLAKKSVDFSGAEIEEAIITALYQAFYEGKDDKKGAELKQRHIEAALEATTPLSKSASSRLEQMAKWAKTNAMDASKTTRKESAGRQLDI